MAHVKTQLRNSAVIRCTGLSTTEDRVFPGRIFPTNNPEPCLCIYTNEEIIEYFEINKQLRNISLVIEGRVLASDDNTEEAEDGVTLDIDATLDSISEEVEKVILSGVRIGPEVSIFLISTEKTTSTRTDGGSVTLTFSVRIITAPGAPDVPII